ncbi:hypothetical protein C7974DRAFT_376315 [Boeremia exigua]|uniref:uncharacterized protein n=1 Tax=Boeremia exigua TaxID=749465 RepID=UPI001E8E2B79|nr:uncharacterized protein C7974DRAFT_376315 [Boeremia exigua]KAH6629479.1 hypothetical protein C7974DRAFT_376315 [Boeremia exigua]
MAAPVNCQHNFNVVKSDTTVVVWNCNMCHSGPHSHIYECSNCQQARAACRGIDQLGSDPNTWIDHAHLAFSFGGSSPISQLSTKFLFLLLPSSDGNIYISALLI